MSDITQRSLELNREAHKVLADVLPYLWFCVEHTRSSCPGLREAHDAAWRVYSKVSDLVYASGEGPGKESLKQIALMSKEQKG